MAPITHLLGNCRSAVRALAARPARGLASFMDDLDEVWLIDPFLDPPEGNPAN